MNEHHAAAPHRRASARPWHVNVMPVDYNFAWQASQISSNLLHVAGVKAVDVELWLRAKLRARNKRAVAQRARTIAPATEHTAKHARTNRASRKR
eukprot:1870972-Rhodomonas_salina.3